MFGILTLPSCKSFFGTHNVGVAMCLNISAPRRAATPSSRCGNSHFMHCLINFGVFADVNPQISEHRDCLKLC